MVNIIIALDIVVLQPDALLVASLVSVLSSVASLVSVLSSVALLVESDTLDVSSAFSVLITSVLSVSVEELLPLFDTLNKRASADASKVFTLIVLSSSIFFAELIE